MQASERIIGSFDIDRIALETLLFQTGYMTIKKKTRMGGSIVYTLDYPNPEVRMSMTGTIFNYLVDDRMAKTKNQTALFGARE